MARFIDTGSRIMLASDYRREQEQAQERARYAQRERLNREWIESVK